MFLFHRFCSVLSTLGFCFCSVLANLRLWQMEAKLLFIDFDNATKATLIQRLIHERIIQHQPTQYPSHMELSTGKIKFKAFDVVSSEAQRFVRDYYAKVDVIVYLIDITDEGSIYRMAKLLELRDPRICDSLTNVPFLIFVKIGDHRVALESLQSLHCLYQWYWIVFGDMYFPRQSKFLLELGRHDFLVEVRRHNFLIEAFLRSVAQKMTEDA